MNCHLWRFFSCVTSFSRIILRKLIFKICSKIFVLKWNSYFQVRKCAAICGDFCILQVQILKFGFKIKQYKIILFGKVLPMTIDRPISFTKYDQVRFIWISCHAITCSSKGWTREFSNGPIRNNLIGSFNVLVIQSMIGLFLEQ